MVEFPTDDLQPELQARSSAELVIEATIMVLITTTATFGNLMVCWAVFRNKSLRTIPNIYVVALAISDILMATLCMPLSVEVLITSKWMESFNVCQFQGFFSFLFAFTSLQIMAAMAINRYYRVVKPSKYRKCFTARRTIASVIIVIASASIGAGLHLICNWAIYTIHYGKVICFTTFKTLDHDKGYIAFLDACYISTPVLVITICYTKIFRTVRAHKKSLFKERRKKRKDKESDSETSGKRTRENQQGNLPELQINVEEVKITKTLFVTVLGFVMCWSPIVIIDMIDSYSSHTLDIPRQVFLLWIYMGYGSSSINPFIYGILNRSFRNEFLRIIRFPCGNKTRVSTTCTLSVIPAQTEVQQGGQLQVRKRSESMETAIH